MQCITSRESCPPSQHCLPVVIATVGDILQSKDWGRGLLCNRGCYSYSLKMKQGSDFNVVTTVTFINFVILFCIYEEKRPLRMCPTPSVTSSCVSCYQIKAAQRERENLKRSHSVPVCGTRNSGVRRAEKIVYT